METPRLRHGAWLVLALLIAVYFLNYFDRQTVSVLKTTLKGEFGMTDSQYSWIIGAFLGPYIFSYFLSGRVVDRWGSRMSLMLFVALWSLATVLCGFAGSLVQLAMARALLGIAEPGCFPAAQRAIVSWFPSERRGFALSLLQPATALGAMAAPPAVALLTETWSWHAAFLAPGILGFIWIFFWLPADRQPQPRATAGAVASREAPVPLRELFRDSRLWAVIGARLISDPLWYFFLFWLPGYLQEKMHLSLSEVGRVTWIPSLVAAVVGVLLARYSDALIARGKLNPIQSRVFVLKLVAFGSPLCLCITSIDNVTLALTVISAVWCVCQVWFFYTSALLAEIFPVNAAGSALGIVGGMGALGGLLFNLAAGPTIDAVGYTALFALASCLHPLAAWLLHRKFRSEVREVALA
ncbi:MAG TPA: MFS transporter [Opitutaceae bacterium]|nr:MFS transporter [Opitutaceae bacterium]